MNAEPITKSLFNKLTANGFTSVKLCFSGGNDEGYLDVYLGPDADYQNERVRNLVEEVENWAWSVYSYSGAGDGSDYGDTIEYDLVNKKVKTSEWCYERKDRDAFKVDLEIAE
jgi:hypothetical protein